MKNSRVGEPSSSVTGAAATASLKTKEGEEVRKGEGREGYEDYICFEQAFVQQL